MYGNSEGKTSLELPYTLIHIYSALGNPVLYSDFKLRLCAIRFPEKNAGPEVRFDILLSSPNVNAAVESGITAGDVYEFYGKLKSVIRNERGHAELREAGKRTRTDLFVSYEQNRKCSLSGYVQDPDEQMHPAAYRGVSFHLVCEPETIASSLAEFKNLFAELEKMSGHTGLYGDPDTEA